ncbi:hypothetical protein ANAPC5_00381 [Anaplasma phagocytophilum]|nr:hypothetical protein ANAPC5_00381 [Anaplasma phagocytophilum]
MLLINLKKNIISHIIPCKILTHRGFYTLDNIPKRYASLRSVLTLFLYFASLTWCFLRTFDAKYSSSWATVG